MTWPERRCTSHSIPLNSIPLNSIFLNSIALGPKVRYG
jgi:hypothetical protein